MSSLPAVLLSALPCSFWVMGEKRAQLLLKNMFAENCFKPLKEVTYRVSRGAYVCSMHADDVPHSLGDRQVLITVGKENEGAGLNYPAFINWLGGIHDFD